MAPARRSTGLTWLASALLVLSPLTSAAQSTNHFEPDWTLEESSRHNWHSSGFGGGHWQSEAEFIEGTPRGRGAWMTLNEHSYQDMQLFVRFRCQAVCDAGVMLRMEETELGHEGLFIALTDSLRPYRISLDKEGRETGRHPLRDGSSMIRIAPPLEEGAPIKLANALPIIPGEWNKLHVTLDANIIRSQLNGWSFGASSGVTEDGGNGYGRIGFYVNGTDPVQFDDLAVMDYNDRHITPETTSDNFTKQRLDEFYYAWDTAIADIDQNGIQDVVSGPYYYLGPDYTMRREIYLGETYNPSTEYALNMITHAADFTGDGWPDVLATDMRAMMLYVNPMSLNRRWERHDVLPNVVSETTIMDDIDNDGQPEVVYALAEGVIAYAEPDPSNPMAEWIEHRISAPMGFRNVVHGLGVGDVNSDGRLDILIPIGWFEQPAEGPSQGKWAFHAFAFNTAGPIKGAGGSTMSVADLNGDGLNDVVASLNAHGWGMAWFEQMKSDSGDITFEPHLIMGDFTWDNPGGVAVSQLHGGVEIADIDNDGVPDLITGKRYWAHLDSSTDPDPYGEAVIYWYRSVRNADAPGGVSFEPELIHNRSGVGSQFEVLDLNEDGKIDIVTSGDRGTFIFWGK